MIDLKEIQDVLARRIYEAADTPPLVRMMMERADRDAYNTRGSRIPLPEENPMRCTRCDKFIYGRFFDMTREPAFRFVKSSEMLKPPPAVELDLSCLECLTEDEIATECVPVAAFVVEQMMRKNHKEGRIGADHPLTSSLAHLRAKFVAETGYKYTFEDLTKQARRSLFNTSAKSRYEGSEMFRRVKSHSSHTVRQAAALIESGQADAEEALTRVLLALAEENARQQEMIVECYARHPQPWHFMAEELVGTLSKPDDRYFDIPVKVDESLAPFEMRFSRVRVDSDGWSEAVKEAEQGPHIFYEDERVVVGTYSDPASLSPGMQAAAGAILEAMTEGSWKCTNHPEGLEITYPVSTLACEVCQMPKP